MFSLNATTRRILARNRHFSSNSVTKCDSIVIGGGIAGASISYRLAKLHGLNVICLEKESSPGYHATGKAFGIFAESNARTIESKIMTTLSRSFLENPDKECIDDYIRNNFEHGILEQTGLLAVSSPEDYPYLYQEFGPSENIKFKEHIQVLPKKDVINMVPFLNSDELAPYSIYETQAANFNTGLVYEHFLVGGHNVGVKYYFNQSAVEINQKNGKGSGWEILSYNAERNSIDRFECDIIINASGQWADDTAIKAGIKPINLITHKRNVIVFTYKQDNQNNKDNQSPFKYISSLSSSSDLDSNNNNKINICPWLGFVSQENGEIFHSCFQGNNGIFLYDKILENGKDNKESHANQDEMQIVLEKISKYTNYEIVKIASKTAGIKSSIKKDRNMVIGCDPNNSSFVWLSALSGWGVQTAAAYSEITSYLATNKNIPSQIIDYGINIDNLLISRLNRTDDDKKYN